MRIFNADKTKELESPDLQMGKLEKDILLTHYEASAEKAEVGHYETVATYPNGGKDVKWVVDIAGSPSVEEHTAIEDIYVYIPFTEDELLEREKGILRLHRNADCFSIINRGKLWYDSLSQQQLLELQAWYQAWLSVTDTLTVPDKPDWLV